MSRTKIAAMERRIVVVGREQLRIAAVLDVEDDHACVAPGHVNAVVIINNFVALNDLRLAVGTIAIERTELLALLLASDVPGADLLRGRRIAVVDDLQTFAIELVGILAAGVYIAVVDIEAVGLAIGRDWHEREFLRLGRI